MRLIDADEAAKKIGSLARLARSDQQKALLGRCIYIIEHCHTIDDEPVRHAVWDNSGRYRFKTGRIAIRCTSCGCALSEYDLKKYKWNYCPVCGAKMDGGADNEN